MRHLRAAVSYAKALFALAKERNQTELVGRELGDLAATFESDLHLRDFFARPWTPATVKRTVATEVAQRSGLSKLISNFVAEKYRKLLDEDLGRERASVRTAVPLTEEERRMLSTKIGQVRQSRQVVLEEIVDPTMLGGVIVESGGVVLDGSLEEQLERMRHRLMAAPPTWATPSGPINGTYSDVGPMAAQNVGDRRPRRGTLATRETHVLSSTSSRTCCTMVISLLETARHAA